MTEHWKKKPRKDIAVYRNQDFYEFQTISIGMLGVADPNVPSTFALIDVTNERIGQLAREALGYSRMLDMDEFQKIWSNKELLKIKINEKYQMLIEKYSYKNKRELLKNMDCCWISLKDNQIEIAPAHHKSLDGYTSNKDTGPFPLYVAGSVSDSELGAAIREGFSHCTTSVK